MHQEMQFVWCFGEAVSKAYSFYSPIVNGLIGFGVDQMPRKTLAGEGEQFVKPWVGLVHYLNGLRGLRERGTDVLHAA